MPDLTPNSRKDRINKDLQADVALTKKQLKRLAREAGVFIRRVKKEMAEMRKEMQQHKDFLNKILEVNKCIDETLCKVLLAIRQNEYLQAWYPETVKHDSTAR
jgi:hypothetical protein